MTLKVVWFGIDYSFTIMNPLTMHHSQVIPQMYRILGRENEAGERLGRWYKLRDSIGNPDDPPHQKVRLLKEYHRDRIYSEVFDSDPKIIEIYAEMEAKERKPSEGLKQALEYLKERGRAISVVSEVSSLDGAFTIVRFLKAHDLINLFEEIITPAGRFTAEGKLLNENQFQGANKKNGLLYERLAAYLKDRGVAPVGAAIVGDDPIQDIEQAKKYGFVTIQYSGLVDRGKTDKADFSVSNWSSIQQII